MTDLVSIARKLRRQQTDAEQILWHQLRNRRLDGLKFRRQVPILGYVADFLCDDAKLVVEVDGSQHAESDSRERLRSSTIESAEFLMLRFWNNDVKLRTQAVLDALLGSVVAARRSPSSGASRHLLPTGEGSKEPHSPK